MDAQGFIQAVLPWLWGLLALAGALALFALARLFFGLNKQVQEMGDKAQPIIEKADVSVDALNAELLRVDGILSDVERITDAAANTTQSVEKIANAPLEIAGTLSGRLRDAFNNFVGDTPASSVDDAVSSASKAASASAHAASGYASGAHAASAWSPVSKKESYVTSSGGAAPATSSAPPSQAPSVPTIEVDESQSPAAGL